MALNIFGDAPQSLTGLLGEQATEDLRKKALTTGLINAAIGYIAQPKTGGYGSALPYLGRALMAGQQGAQGVYEGAITDFDRQQKISEMQRKQQQREAQEQFLEQYSSSLPENQRAAVKAYPELGAKIAESSIVPGKRETIIAPNGQLIYKDTGEVVTQQSFAALDKGTSKQQDYNFYAQQETAAGKRPLSFNQWDLQTAAASAPKSTINVGGTGVAPKKIDEKFADQFVDWTVGGGFSDVQKSLTQLGSAVQALEKAPEGSITGKLVGVTPDSALKLVNPTAAATKEAVEEVVQRNLRLVLGAQFTEKEGERLISRAYNPSLSQKENARRVKLLQEQIFEAAQAKQDAVDYYNQNGTIYGWKGKVFNSTGDFLNEYNKRLTGKKTPIATPSVKVPSGVDQKVWNVMTPEEKALWQN